MGAPVLERDAGAEHKGPDDVGDENLTRSRLPRDPRANVNGETGDRILPVLDLTGVQTGPDLEPKIADAVAGTARAPYRTRRPAEPGEQTMPSRARPHPGR